MSETQVKAIFLFNLAEFTEWPADAFENPGAPINVGIIGDGRIGTELERMSAGRKIRKRELHIRKFDRGQEIKNCQILFVSASEKKQIGALLQSLSGASVLTISDASRFIEGGGAIQISVVEDRVHFEINLAAVTHARLRISSKLLSLTRMTLADRRSGGN